MPPTKPGPKILKVLIVRFSSIGDIVLCSPVIRCLKLQRDASIHFITKSQFATLVEANPYIDRIHSIDQHINEILPKLRQERFDYIIDLHNNLRSFQLRLAMGIRSTKVSKLNWQKWLMVKLKSKQWACQHIVDRYLKAVAPLGVHNDAAGLDYFIPLDEEVDVVSKKEGVEILKSDITKVTPIPQFIAFAIGAAHTTKCLPTEKIIAIVRRLSGPVILLGGLLDQSKGEEIELAVGPRVHNACGSLSVHQSASVIRQARLVISHDTGMMHIAAAFGKRIVSIWGSTVPQFGMYPYYPKGVQLNTTVEVKGLSCRPCSKIGYARCPKGHFKCMQEIDEKFVVKGTQ